MATHTAAIQEAKQLSDGQVAVRIRCCGDATTDSWHTITLTGGTPQAEIEAWEGDRISYVQNQHASLQAGLAYLQSKAAK